MTKDRWVVYGQFQRGGPWKELSYQRTRARAKKIISDLRHSLWSGYRAFRIIDMDKSK